MITIQKLTKRVLRPESESGQAIVLVALFMVVLLAMLGVAIDGGGLFLLWRDAQNAADTAVLQSAYSRCTSPFGSTTWIVTGETAAAVNGFPAADPNSTVTVRPWPDDTNFVEVIIDAEKPAYFIQLVYGGPLSVRARALAYCQRAFDPSQTGGAVGLMECDVCAANQSDQITLTGADVTFNGPLHSNCNIYLNPAGNDRGTVNGEANAVGSTDNQNNKTDITGGANNGVDKIDADYLNAPLSLYAPGGEIASLVDVYYAVDTDNDGFYPIDDDTPDDNVWDTSDIPGGVVQGLIYVDGHINNDTSNWGAIGATLVATGKVDFANNSDDDYRFYGWNSQVTGDAGITVEVSTGDVYPSFLAYAYEDQLDPLQCANMTSQGNAAITTRGNGTVLYGVLYAPHGGIAWAGSQIVGEGALIGQKIDFAGSSTTYTFNPAMLPPRAPRINIVQ